MTECAPAVSVSTEQKELSHHVWGSSAFCAQLGERRAERYPSRAGASEEREE